MGLLHAVGQTASSLERSLGGELAHCRDEIRSVGWIDNDGFGFRQRPGRFEVYLNAVRGKPQALDAGDFGERDFSCPKETACAKVKRVQLQTWKEPCVDV